MASRSSFVLLAGRFQVSTVEVPYAAHCGTLLLVPWINIVGL